jgi:hypothetical protein
MDNIPINGLCVCTVMFKPTCSVCGKVIDNLKLHRYSDIVDDNNAPIITNIEPKECPHCKSHIKSVQTDIRNHITTFPPSNGLTM